MEASLPQHNIRPLRIIMGGWIRDDYVPDPGVGRLQKEITFYERRFTKVYVPKKP